MQEVVIQYKNPKVLEVLRSISELFGFKVLTPRKVAADGVQDDLLDAGTDSGLSHVNGVPLMPANGQLHSGGMGDIFKGVVARKLRDESWTRNSA